MEGGTKDSVSLSNLPDHGTGRYGLAKDSDCYALCRKIRYAINRFFYHNSKFNSHRTTHVTPITARKDTSSRLTLSLNKNITPVHACPMPFITTRPNHHVKDIVGCARLPFPFTALERRLALDSPTERRGGVCPLSLLSAGGIFQLAAGGLRAPKPAQAARRARNRQRLGQGERGASQPRPCRGVRRGTGLQRRQGDLP